MEDIVMFLGAFGSFAFVAWVLVQGFLRWWEISRQTKVMGQLVQHVDGGEEALRVLESSTVRSLFDRMVDRRTLVLQRVLRALQSGILLIVVGVAMLFLRTQFADDDDVLGALVFGTLTTALGTAFLVAAAVSYTLSSRWGLLKESS